jgi:hypothetical protein
MTLFSFRKTSLAVVAALGVGLSGYAQMPNLDAFSKIGGAAATDFATLAKLLGDHKEFTAKLDVRVYDRDQKEKVSAPMEISRLGDKMRMEIEMEKLTDSSLPGGNGSVLAQLGMDRIILLMRPDKGSRSIVIPGIQAILKNELTAAEKADFEKKPKFETTTLGKETLEGQACVKSKVVVTNDNGKVTEYTVWRASDLKDFPVQVMTKEKSDTVILRYKDVKFAKPDAKLFEAPADCKEYADPKEMMQAVVAKMMKDAAEASAAAEPPATPAPAEKPKVDK